MFSQWTCGEATANLRDSCGKPFPLTDEHRVCLIAKESVFAREFYLNIPVAVTDQSEAEVTVSLTEDQLHAAGLFLGEFVVFLATPEGSSSSSSMPSSSSSAPGEEEDTDKVVARFPCYIEVGESLQTGNMPVGLSIAEIRLVMRDRCPADNFLLDRVEFSDTEIAFAIRHPIDMWNDTPPPLQPRYTVNDFPYRYYWSDAAVGELLTIAGHNYERNRLQYAAGNLSVDDKDKAKYYTETGRAMIETYRIWMLNTKKALNMQLAYGRTSLRSYGNRSLYLDNSARGLSYGG
jgi:hypothetical protein